MLLVHICCADCFARTLAGLRLEFGDGFAVRGFFYNPNIHPLLEFRRRMKSVHVYLERDPVPVVFDDTYGLEMFCARVHPGYRTPRRCRTCYDLRLGTTAARAAELGCSAFTTTLTTSRHQDHTLIRTAAEEAAVKHGVRFMYRDLRESEVAPRLVSGLYRQQYCGCVFSEAERFGATSRHLYRGRAGANSESA